MIIATSKLGISITYKCYHFPGNGKKCPDKYTFKCYHCKYCRAELSAHDATRLMNTFQKAIADKYINK